MMTREEFKKEVKAEIESEFPNDEAVTMRDILAYALMSWDMVITKGESKC
jgi:hypothetical protein